MRRKYFGVNDNYNYIINFIYYKIYGCYVLFLTDLFKKNLKAKTKKIHWLKRLIIISLRSTTMTLKIPLLTLSPDLCPQTLLVQTEMAFGIWYGRDIVPRPNIYKYIYACM